MSAPAPGRFATTSSRGLRLNSAPMRLYQQAKRAAAWDPRAIDFATDARDWRRLTDVERDLLLRLTALFQAGEEGMTLDAAPLLVSVARERRLEEEIFLATLLADEAKHTEFFRRVLDDVCRATDDLDRFHSPSFRALFSEELPRLMSRLLEDPSPAALAEAVVAYTLIGEGVLSETGHHLYVRAVRPRALLPGLLSGLAQVQRDEARHMTFGVYLLSRLVGQDPAVWPVVQRSMNVLLAQALGIVTEFFEPYPRAPFGLTLEDTVSYAMSRFARRSARIERAQKGGVPAVERAGDPGQEMEEWLAERVAPGTVTRANGPGGILLLQVRHDAGPSSLLVTVDVLERYVVEEITAALDDRSVPERLGAEPGLRLACLEVGGRIALQEPTGGTGTTTP